MLYRNLSGSILSQVGELEMEPHGKRAYLKKVASFVRTAPGGKGGQKLFPI